MYSVDIDFDYASKCWRQNKKYKGKGYFVYICNYVHSNGKRCRRTIVSSIIENKYKTQFEHFELNDYFIHPNAHIFCKRHLNRNPYPYIC
jgi:hypothetical protein